MNRPKDRFFYLRLIYANGVAANRNPGCSEKVSPDQEKRFRMFCGDEFAMDSDCVANCCCT